MRYAESVIDLIGGTPLVRLRHVVGDVAPTVLAKVEYLNPGGSVKDRIAVRMIDAAEADGSLQPGGTIVEPTRRSEEHASELQSPCNLVCRLLLDTKDPTVRADAQ